MFDCSDMNRGPQAARIIYLSDRCLEREFAVTFEVSLELFYLTVSRVSPQKPSKSSCAMRRWSACKGSSSP